MLLKEWKEKNKLSLDELSEVLGVSRSILHRVCRDDHCFKTADAHRIIIGTGGAVGMEDLLPEDC
jgi:predicted transcriptional regulator